MRRTVLAAIAIVMLLSMLPGTALAWCNGPTKNGSKGAGYGSHDWILDQALKQAGASGKWVYKKTALVHTDDPDSLKWAATTQHYFEDGTCRGAPQTVSDLYHKAIVAYQAGDKSLASKYLGQLSHCYTDILQPFHSAKAANAYKALHKQYEFAVDDHQNTTTKSRSWLTLRPTQLVTDITTKTIDAAVYARSQFPALLKSYKAHRSVTKGTPLKITKRVMSRAVNDLADIIRSIPEGVGETTAPATVDIDVSRPTLLQNQSQVAHVSLLGASGLPLNAIGVKFTWHMATRTVVWSSYTDSNGYISRHMDVGSAPVGVPLSVTMKFSVNGTTTSQTRTFTPVKRR